MPDFASIDNPTVQDRLSYWGQRVQESVDEYNNALPKVLGVEWQMRHIAIGVEFAAAQIDARLGIHENGEPLWTIKEGDPVLKDGKVIRHSALNESAPGDIFCYFLRLEELNKKGIHELFEETLETLELTREVDIAKANCFEGRGWN